MSFVLKEISKYSKFAIYGAQVVACGAYFAIKHLSGRLPESFVVSRLAGNPREIDGIPVCTLEAVPKDALIIVAVTELLQREINRALKAGGYANTVDLTCHEEHLLMSAYFESIGRFPVLKKENREYSTELALYEVRSCRDKPLSAPPVLQQFEYPIQAGAAVTRERIAAITDDTGDNISHKNKQYCEMTATYWVWKNTRHEWKGIEHYRRHLRVTPQMLGDGADAVLPLPYICYPDTMHQFGRFVSTETACMLLKALRDLHPREYEDYSEILYGRYQYTYNLVCAKKEVFDDYCQWFFEITGYMERFSDKAPELAFTRALSYVAEALTNLYFMYNRNKLKIAHAEKEIYV